MPAEDLDDLVQHLVVAKMALEARDESAALTSLDIALTTARRLLTDAHDNRLVRRRPAT